MQQEGLNRDAIYWHYPHYSGGLGGRPDGATRKGDWKLIEFFEDGLVELYNIKQDIGEQHDLARVHPHRAAKMLADLKAWQKETRATFPTPNPNYKGSK